MCVLNLLVCLWVWVVFCILCRLCRVVSFWVWLISCWMCVGENRVVLNRVLMFGSVLLMCVRIWLNWVLFSCSWVLISCRVCLWVVLVLWFS